MKQKTKRKVAPVFILLFIIAVAALWVVIYVRPVVEDALTQTEVIEYGSMQVTDEATCYFVRDEEVFYAADNGSIQYYFEEGELVRKGSRILEIFPSDSGYFAGDSGCVVSYYSDGYENSFSPERMTEMDKTWARSLDLKMENLSRDTAVEGEALYKLVKNDRWYVLFWVETEDIVKYTKGASVKLELPLGEIQGTTYDILDAGGEWKVILKFNRYYEDMAKLRKQAARVITADHKGLMVRNISITNEGDQAGVYVKSVSGDFVFTPVKVIISDGEYSLVEAGSYYEKTEEGREKVSTIDAYDEILTDAQS